MAKKIIVQGVSPNELHCCDKCGRRVPSDNNAVYFDAALGNMPPEGILFAVSRHLLPVVEDGVVICTGSPSRAQYVEGQPRDPRAAFAYNPAKEGTYRAAYRKMQQEARARA